MIGPSSDVDACASSTIAGGGQAGYGILRKGRSSYDKSGIHFMLHFSTIPLMAAARAGPRLRLGRTEGRPRSAPQDAPPHSLLSYRHGFETPLPQLRFVFIYSSSGSSGVVSIILDQLAWPTNRPKEILLPSLRLQRGRLLLSPRLTQ